MPSDGFYHYPAVAVPCGLFEQELGKLVEAAAPGVPFVGGAVGNVTYGVHSKAPEGFGCFHYPGVLLASGAHEHHFVGLLVAGCALNVFNADGSAAEQANVCECGGVGNGDPSGLHSSH